jgi:hypothetical protein
MRNLDPVLSDRWLEIRRGQLTRASENGGVVEGFRNGFISVKESLARNAEMEQSVGK